MSLLQYPEAMKASEIQIWNNAAFDGGDLEPLKPIFVNLSDESLESAARKENQSPVYLKSPNSIKSPRPIKPLCPNNTIKCSEKNQVKSVSKLGLFEKVVRKSGNDEEAANEKRIDREIEEIVKEIGRLTSRLEALRVEKAEKNVKTVERRGRVVPAKFMDQKQTVKKVEGKKMEEISSLSARTKFLRKGGSLGPADIVAGTRRGLSLGPSEIISGIKSRQPGKQEITPVQPIQNRRKSCFWKLQDIDEEKKAIKESGKCLTVSPKSRKTIGMAQIPRQFATTTLGLKKAVMKEDGFLSSIQPKKLFKDPEKSVPVKKPIKPGRVVASRYNQTTGNSALRKRSLPESEEDESKRCDKKRSLSAGKSRGLLPELNQSRGTESQVRKKLEIPSEIDKHSPPFFQMQSIILPAIKTFRCPFESPRDSGPAKRVAELGRRNSYFFIDDEGEPKVCQALSFLENEDEQEK